MSDPDEDTPDSLELLTDRSSESRGGGGVRSGIGSHQSAKSGKDEWLTPPDMIRGLGPFDLDPCAPIVRPWPTAAHHFTVADDGLSKRWFGRVWLNPPYGQHTGHWLERMRAHGNGLSLIFARTETDVWIRHVWGGADSVLFLHGRLYFWHVSGKRADANSGAPSALVAYGSANTETLKTCGFAGSLVRLGGGGGVSPKTPEHTAESHGECRTHGAAVNSEIQPQ